MTLNYYLHAWLEVEGFIFHRPKRICTLCRAFSGLIVFVHGVKWINISPAGDTDASECSKGVKTASRASDCYCVNQSDIQFILRWPSERLCHQYPACASSPSPSSSCNPLKPFNSQAGDRHQMKLNWRSLTRMTLIFIDKYTGHFQPFLLQICPSRVSLDVLGSSLLVEPCVFSLRICAYRCTSMSPLEWWMSPTPKYHLLFINMKTSWWEVHPCPSMFT